MYYGLTVAYVGMARNKMEAEPINVLAFACTCQYHHQGTNASIYMSKEQLKEPAPVCSSSNCNVTILYFKVENPNSHQNSLRMVLLSFVFSISVSYMYLLCFLWGRARGKVYRLLDAICRWSARKTHEL